MKRQPFSVRAAAISQVAAAVVFACGASRGGAQTTAGLLALLQPGGLPSGEIVPDGFRSAFDDERGWWSRGRPVARPTLRLVRRHDEPITGRLSDGEMSLLERGLLLEGAVTRPTRCVEGTFGLRYTGSDRAVSLSGPDGDARLAERTSRLDGCWRATAPRLGVTLQAGAPLWRERGEVSGTGRGWGLRYESAAGFGLQCASTIESDGAPILFHVLDNPVAFRLNLETRSWRYALRFPRCRRIRAEIQGSSRRHLPLSPSRSQGYVLRPDGRSDGFECSLVADAGAGHEFVYRYTELIANGEADFAKDGARCGRVEAYRANVRSHLLGWRARRVAGVGPRLECELGHADLFAHASLQSWPFTETVVDLLGAKKVIAATLAADWHRLTLVADLPGRVVGGSCGLSWFRIRPEGRNESWRRILVFDVDEYRRDDLDVARIDLLSALLTLRATLDRRQLSITVQQFFWGSVQRAGNGGGGGSAPASPSPSIGEDRRGWYGGTYVVAGVTLAM